MVIGAGAVLGFFLLGALAAGQASADPANEPDRGLLGGLLSPDSRADDTARGGVVSGVVDQLAQSVRTVSAPVTEALAPVVGAVPVSGLVGPLDRSTRTVLTPVSHTVDAVISTVEPVVGLLGQTVAGVTRPVGGLVESVVDTAVPVVTGVTGLGRTPAAEPAAGGDAVPSSAEPVPVLDLGSGPTLRADRPESPDRVIGAAWATAAAGGPTATQVTGQVRAQRPSPADPPGTPFAAAGGMSSATPTSGQSGPAYAVVSGGPAWDPSEVLWRGPSPDGRDGAWLYRYGRHHPS
ncbi:hypothetical protein [Actinokineospora sp.]|uniref:hypothetical protein n=1 Tax=Actinokineospora sp. TaxID=1872133 RepID=UPI0040380A65